MPKRDRGNFADGEKKGKQAIHINLEMGWNHAKNSFNEN